MLTKTSAFPCTKRFTEWSAKTRKVVLKGQRKTESWRNGPHWAARESGSFGERKSLPGQNFNRNPAEISSCRFTPGCTPWFSWFLWACSNWSASQSSKSCLTTPGFCFSPEGGTTSVPEVLALGVRLLSGSLSQSEAYDSCAKVNEKFSVKIHTRAALLFVGAPHYVGRCIWPFALSAHRL